ncbi:ABC transporter ATP-binding protein [Citricoccus muralis]|uniref:ATP-binding cassette domain-containing protein n=1 Tax=Citricoccus muralis TaxID=169134 RepID=A0ABY8H6D3_9MICC|nr:ATP-binding cassette domain-containing protein [Citricoccus muralis]WFP16680.1 ATP-binding cassette domain-containing protein [Citricoccus muralis]
MSYTEPLLDVSRLSKSFGTHRVLDQVTFRLPPGLHALLGPNGAGKTTLVNILSTLIRADAGRVRVLGLDPQADQRRLRSLISVTGQYAAVDQRLTGTENMLMMGQLFGLSRAETRRRGGRLLERFDLTTAAARPVSTYSGGMRRKLDLALCLIAAPQLIFLDEPTTGLDTRSRLALWDEITALARAGTSIFLTTQYLEEAEALADRILVLHDGGIVAEGTAVELKERLGAATLEDVFLALTETSATETGATPNTTPAEKTSEKAGSAA